MKNEEIFSKQVDEIHSEYLSLRGCSKFDDISDVPEIKIIRFNTRARALIQRICNVRSAYFKEAEKIIGGFPGYQAAILFGIVDSLKADVSAGYLKTQTELIHRELFADFLEMANHLLSEGYKDAAAVIAGSSLEVHLRNLSINNGIPTNTMDKDKSVSKKAERLNSDLVSNKVYNKLDQKNVTAWLDLRNKAAHGYYDNYDKEQVNLMIAGIRNFISRIPA